MKQVAISFGDILSQSPQIGSSLLIQVPQSPWVNPELSQSPQIGSSLLIYANLEQFSKCRTSQSPQIGSSLLIMVGIVLSRALLLGLNPLKSGLLF